MATYKEIWNTLSKVDCSEHAESKNGLTYLSWAWAWGMLMNYYPHAKFSILPEEHMQDGTVICNVEIYIDECARSMWLPVLDYRNKPISNPSSWNINTTRMRVLTKCIGLYGLGHYIYAGEDLPAKDTEVNVKSTHKPTVKNSIKSSNSRSASAKKTSKKEVVNEEVESLKQKGAYKEKLQDKVDRSTTIVLQESISEIDNVESLRAYWRKNSKAIESMSELAQLSIKKFFSARAEELTI